MKKVLIPLSVIAVIAIAVASFTSAFLKDDESSENNSLTAGTLDLLVDNKCEYNGKSCLETSDGEYYWEGTTEPCSCAWSLKNLEEDDLFFNFSDIKPGDEGRDSISLHVDDNNAWACAKISPLINDDNSCTEPEDVVDDTCDLTGGGELSDHIYFSVWADHDCDNQFDSASESYLVEDVLLSSAKDGIVLPIADKSINVFSQNPNDPLLPQTDYCLGVLWIVPVCTGNVIQSDIVKGDITFYAEQQRNNPDFLCSQVNF